MLAYVILAHHEFDAAADLISHLYDPQNLYCICVNRSAIVKALDELHPLTIFPNVRIIPTPRSAWGVILENLTTGIDFCLRFDAKWRSLILLSGTHIALASPSAIGERVNQEFGDNIVISALENQKEFDADIAIQRRSFEDPFRTGPATHYDNADYNPFTYNRRSTQREGISYHVLPDAMRAGWSESSHFVTNLTKHTFVPEHNTVYVDSQEPLIRRLLEKYFDNRTISIRMSYSILPRDFCDFCVNSMDALTYFALIKNSFAGEESYFSTLALNSVFRERFINWNPSITGTGENDTLSIENVKAAAAGGHLFAKKTPSGDLGRGFRAEAYSHLSIPARIDLAQLRRGNAETYQEILQEQLSRHLKFVDTRFTMGIFNDRSLACFTVATDLSLQYHEDRMTPEAPAGHRWQWRDGGYDVFNANGDTAGRFDGLRIHGDRLYLFGYWPWAEVLTLVCVADVLPMLTAPVSNSLLQATDKSRELRLDQHLWHYWSSDKERAVIRFFCDGTIHPREDGGDIVGHWRLDDGRLLAFGLDDMPIALFDQISGDDGRWTLAGVSWGRKSPVEPCFLISI